MWLVNLDPTQGSEINKTRPCVVISPDELNRYLRTITIAALTSSPRTYPSRIDCAFQSKAGQVALDHIRSIDKTRLVRRLGVLEEATAREICLRLAEIISVLAPYLHPALARCYPLPRRAAAGPRAGASAPGARGRNTRISPWA
ncbi:MAG: type II toxin-antitoxin system PemK/MazF family toxin [Hymenobacter sp.]